MHNDIQKASLWKRIAAGILDVILLVVLATGVCWALSAALDYSQWFERSEEIRAEYTQKFNLPEELTQEYLDQLTPEEYEAYLEKVRLADEAVKQDEEAIRVYSLVVNLSLLIASGGILLSMLLLEFIVPLILGNGQTVGKKVFALCLIRNDGVKINTLQLFTRFLLGKFAVGVMIPVYSVIMILLNVVNPPLLLLAIAILVAQVICVAATRNNCLLHDLMAGTVVVDYSSQQIFKTTDDLIAYQQKIAAERAARQKY